MAFVFICTMNCVFDSEITFSHFQFMPDSVPSSLLVITLVICQDGMEVAMVTAMDIVMEITMDITITMDRGIELMDLGTVMDSCMD